ncbi:acyl-CoA dehydrogenase family protein, partial [Streptomyces sp. H27-D2]|uniref:acyl-CoA dehydrogenase family protein n=1 Tax=Streptomyces sp. H27-D2 TaxID=3046304 RepID=UPI002DB94F7E
MRFLLDDEQAEFGRTLDRMLTAADTPAAVRAWADGDQGPGRALWERLGEAGVFALAVPEAYDGLGPLPVELAVAFVELGRHAAPGPLVETVAAAVLLDSLAQNTDGTGDAQSPGGGADLAKEWLPRFASGQSSASLALPGSGPYTLDPDAADATFLVTDTAAPAGRTELRLTAGHSPLQRSLDPARRLARPLADGPPLASGPPVRAAADRAATWAAFATAAQSLGVGLALVERTVAYAKQRTQFSTVIGSFQAVKHQLADALIGLEFARPLRRGAA